MVKVAVFASGSGSNFENLAKAKLKYAKISLLLVDRQDAYAIERAKKLGIDWVFVDPKGKTKTIYEKEVVAHLEKHHIEFIALAGYMRFVGNVLLSSFPKRIVNLHPAYLPSFPGAHSILDAYEAKVPYSGVTLHYVDEGIDTGEIIEQEKVVIINNMSLREFEDAIHQKEYDMFPRVLDKVCKEVEDEKSIA